MDLPTGSVFAHMFDSSPAEIKQPINLPPDISGVSGKAWSVDLAGQEPSLKFIQKDDATLTHWVVEAPWAHPVWHSYSIVLLHLRPLVGKTTLFYKEGATHEIWVYAQNPDSNRTKLIQGGPLKDYWLHPMNFAAQFIELTDELALERVKGSVQQICDGKLSPDTDFIQDWARLYGNNMMKDRPNPKSPIIK